MDSVTSLHSDIKSLIRGNVSIVDFVTSKYRSNFEGLVSIKPRIVIETGFCEDISAILYFCRVKGIRVTIRGLGHGFGKMGIGPDVLIVFKSKLQARLADEEVIVSGSSNWFDLELFLNKHNRSLPVLTNHPEVTIGGSLSSGGYGEKSICNFGQIDNVSNFKLVLPNGELTEVGEETNYDLYLGVLSGYGQLGVITEAKLKTFPYNPDSHIYKFTFESFSTFFEYLDNMQLQNLPDYFSAYYDEKILAFIGWNLPVNISETKVVSKYLGVQKDWGSRAGFTAKNYDYEYNDSHIWRNYALGFEEGLIFGKYLEKEILRTSLFRKVNGRLLMFAILRPSNKKHKFYLDPISPNIRKVVVGFGLHFNPSLENINVAIQLQNKICEIAFQLNARPYLGTFIEASESIKNQVFGEGLKKHQMLKHGLDPERLLNGNISL